MNSTRQRVILRTQPSLVGSALGACLAARPGFDIVVDPDHAFLSGAGERDVVVVSTPIESLATVFVLSSDHVSIIRAGSFVSYPYRDLEQLCALISAPNPADSFKKSFLPGGGAIDENAL